MTHDTPLKTCRKCGIDFPATTEHFLRALPNRDGLGSYCKQCRKTYRENWQKHNPGYAAEKAKAWRAKNAGKKLTEKDTARKRRARHKNPEKYREITRRGSKRFRQKYPEKIRAYQRQWRKENPEKIRARTSRYLARKKAANGNHTGEDIVKLYKAQKGKCWWCGTDVRDDYHVDHRIPLSRGGSNDPNNLCISCPPCNQSKGGKLPHEWNGRLL